MTLDELKQLLADGKITKEQFLAMAKALDPNYTEEDEQGGDGSEGGSEGANGGDNGASGSSSDDIEKLIQRAVDRATNKLGNDNKKLRETIEKLKKDKLSDDDRKQFEIDERERTIAEREQALKEKENRLYAVKALKNAGLDDGSPRSLELVDFVMDEDETAIDNQVKAFATLVQKFVKDEVDKTFKQGGRQPGKGTGGSSEKNPWAKETWNLTEQMKLEIADPERAKALKAAAGLK